MSANGTTAAKQAASLRDLADEIEAGVVLPITAHGSEAITIVSYLRDVTSLSALGPDFDLSWTSRRLITVVARRGAVEMYGHLLARDLPEEIWPADRPDD